MTVSATPRKAGPFDGNGVTTSFPFDFKVFSKAEIQVVRADQIGVEATLTLDSDYTVTLNPDQDSAPGGSVIYAGPPVLPTGWKLVILGATPVNQVTDITNVGRFNPDVIERTLDRTTIQIQQLEESIGRAVQVPPSSDTDPKNLLQELTIQSNEVFAARDEVVNISVHFSDEANARLDVIQAEGDAIIASTALQAAQQRVEIRSQADVVLGSIGYQPPVPYAAGLSMTAPNQTVSYFNGVSTSTYAPIATYLPFTTSGSFEVAKFRLIQGVSGADLGASSGSLLVGTQAPGTGSASMTVGDALDLAPVDLLKKVPQSEWAAIANGTSNYDIRPALVNAVGNGRRVTVSKPGVYVFSTAYSGTTHFDIEATCDGVIFDLRGITGAAGISNSGSLTQIPDLNSDVVAGTRTLPFTSAPGVVKGDWICIYNPTNGSWSNFPGRPYYRAGEWCEVTNVSGNTVTVARPLYASYIAADVDVYRMNSVRFRMVNIAVLGATQPVGLIKCSLSVAPVLERMKGTHANDSLFEFDRCVLGKQTLMFGRNEGNGGDDYGIVASNCQHIRVIDSEVYARRHGITVGGGDNICAVPSRDIRVIRGRYSNDIASGVESANFHGNVEDSSFEDVISESGFTLGGKNVSVNGGYGGANQTGSPVAISEVVGGTMAVRRAKLETSVNPQTINRGIIDGGSTNTVTANTKEAVTFEVRDVTVVGRNLSDSTSFLMARNAGSTQKLNIDVQGVTFDVNALGNVVVTFLDSGTAASDRIIVDGITGAPTGMLNNLMLYNAAGGAYLGANFPMRMQRQGGRWQATTTASTDQTSSYFVFPMRYPRTPQIVLKVGGKDGASFNGGTVGGQIVRDYVLDSNATRQRLRLTSSSAMSSGVDFEVSWNAEIREC
ncbi:hypothetical protein APR50_10455 [Variovorax paradoxus]|uniref:phage tailspike polysaccharide lyase family protein n=1 Tax=Variovorax paradoxus TaxID=34073 RepID=UPI0006E4C45F|nr:hypothetical protein APR52_20705 [Variovorax paradoxus]KPV08884.1 hypothetical protein APR50_10455 [Variovorax paradoxus]KPV11381.1 hypothetical protein APR49_09330 [Variovorax paradoxus]KPV23273.1 hypothetical protein APR51_07905 [Variovorax paradoxus]KPV31161.1 hypothetical protein APR48_17700 [Variovorax paradoxus]